MTEAPEKIWASDINAGVLCVRPWFDTTEYTRSDIANAAVIDLINQNAELIKEVAALQAQVKETA
jgi:hypothetical protein